MRMNMRAMIHKMTSLILRNGKGTRFGSFFMDADRDSLSHNKIRSLDARYRTVGLFRGLTDLLDLLAWALAGTRLGHVDKSRAWVEEGHSGCRGQLNWTRRAGERTQAERPAVEAVEVNFQTSPMTPQRLDASGASGSVVAGTVVEAHYTTDMASFGRSRTVKRR